MPRPPNPRESQPIFQRDARFDFRLHPEQRWFEPQADPASEYWAFLRFFSDQQRCRDTLQASHSWTESDVKTLHAELAAYIEHAYQFFVAAQGMPTTTAPLGYYYSFLNLTKSLLLVRTRQTLGPRALHGLTYTFEAKRVRLQNEAVRVREGVFREWAKQCESRQPPEQLFISDLMLLCPSLADDVKSGLQRNPDLLLIEPEFVWSPDRCEAWVRLYVGAPNARKCRVTSRDIVAACRSRMPARHVATPADTRYDESGRRLLFESTSAIPSGYFDAAAKSRLIQQARDLRIIRHHADCYLPLDRRAAVSPMSATSAIMFYLGSLVRYQPEYVDQPLPRHDQSQCAGVSPNHSTPESLYSE